ncbi:MAG TPA: condensation domain-containing protein, partial [Ktedonobacteraceae bacterium]|nr:condensation domain-containing protein [Ktedonobacteraceae bacterium]
MDDLTKRVGKLDPDKLKLLILQASKKKAEIAPTGGITRRKERDTAPLSFAQQRLWFLNQLVPNNPFYNVPLILRLSGPIQLDALEKSIQQILSRHEALRTTFIYQQGQFVQSILPQSHLPSQPLLVFDISPLPVEQREQEIQHLILQEARYPFNLSSDLMLRARVIRVAQQEHVLLLTLHHVACDGWSLGIIHYEISTLYNALINNQPSPLAPLPIQYADFAYWQRQLLQGEVLASHMNYWRQQLADLTQLALPYDFPRPAIETFRGAYSRVRIPRELTGRLKELSQQTGVTLFMTLLTTFAALLSLYTGQTNLAIGTPIANRTQKELEGLIGFFVNTLVIRCDLQGDPTFIQALQRVREVTLEAYTHQDLPFEQIVEELRPERTLSHNPLCQVLFQLQNAPRQAFAFKDLTLRAFDTDNQTARFDQVFSLSESEQGLIGRWEYNTDLFRAETIEGMIAQYLTLLTQIVEHPTRPLSSLSLLSASQRDHVLALGHPPTYAPPAPANLALLLRQQLPTRADAIALVGGEHHLSSAALLRRATQLAHLLRQQGVGPETAVGVCLPRSLELILALLAIVQAGGVYVPLDPDLPAARLAFQLSDAHVSLLLTDSSEVARLPATSLPCLQLDTLASQLALLPDTPLPLVPDPDAALALLYTSGSSGAPKAVICVQRGVLRLARDPQV